MIENDEVRHYERSETKRGNLGFMGFYLDGHTSLHEARHDDLLSLSTLMGSLADAAI